MKRKASIVALDDLMSNILNSYLLDGLNKKQSPLKEMEDEEEDESEDYEDESEEDTELELEKKKAPKVIEFSVTRMGKVPPKDLRDMKKVLGGQFTEKEASTFLKKKKTKKRR
jgi:hypothetical protein